MRSHSTGIATHLLMFIFSYRLETLVLEANEPLRATDEGDDDDSGVFDELKSLNICRTGINSWENFDAVFKPRGRTRFPKLRDLATSGCPLFAGA